MSRGTIKRRSECSKEGTIGRRREREGCEGSNSEMLRVGEGYGGQLGPVLNGSDRLVQSANEC